MTNYPVSPDEEIVRQISDGDLSSGIITLMEAHGGIVAAYLIKRFRGTLSEDQRNDALIDGAVRVYETICKFDSDKSPLSAWFCHLARNAAIDLLRQEGRHAMARSIPSEMLDEFADDGNVSEEFAVAVGELHNAVERLPQRIRRVFQLYLREGTQLSIREQAKKLNISATTIYKYRSKGFELLRAALNTVAS